MFRVEAGNDKKLTGFVFGIDQEGWMLQFYHEDYDAPVEYESIIDALHETGDHTDVQYFITALFTGDFGDGDQLLDYEAQLDAKTAEQ